ncbi:phosphatidate cytidylyltransferase [Jidongwangia harbinensis]|uniref:phosphatidate cytidylyltransferase n=1 Tax=Jidongwangia harbinensis TaxID=2878561 RepID=UPI001CD9A568|nr:phosphatidate cytidylyltransferase [Jidongwangia harbinensis]MCA2215182.1 phosphatidate cytidylyltransferase [Jidongwangia harbinensis]
MSYLDPRSGPTPSGDRPSDRDAPAPYAAYWVPESDAGTNGAGADGPPYRPAAPPWDAPNAATSTSEAEYHLAAGPKGPGRRRASGDGKARGRAGRNLPAAIAVGLSLCLVVLASLVVWKEAFLGVIAIAAGVGVWEMCRALRTTGAHPPLIPLLAGTVLMTGLAWYSGEDGVVLGLVVTVLAAVLWRLADRPAHVRQDLTASMLIAVYVPFLLSFGVLLSLPDDGDWRVLCTLLAVVLSDTGGYAAGVFFGRHAMAPRISPKKSWEGFAGSVTAAAVGSSLLLYFLLDVPFYWGLVFGAVISVVAVLGDLAESMLKRDLAIKDMSRLLPGHGGLMDRLDSILFAVPTAYLLLSLVAPPG